MRTYRDLLCVAFAVTVVINAVLNVAQDTLNALISFLATLCGVLVFFHFSILFSANAKGIHIYIITHLLTFIRILPFNGERIIGMALYTIADLHLSTLSSTNKSMEKFGHRWDSYMQRIEANWRHLIGEEDTVIIPGDVSWALSLEEATSDLKFIDSLPGKKIIGEGNHDFWWMTMKKHEAHFEKNGIKTISFLFNNAHETDDFVIAGTRGWFLDEKIQNAVGEVDFAKLVAREELRLKTSLERASELAADTGREIIVFMHFPPVFGDFVAEGQIALLKQYGISRVYYGHIHGNYSIPPYFCYDGINFHIVSADYLNFTPKFIYK